MSQSGGRKLALDLRPMETGITLAIGFAGAALFWWIGFPVPFLTGPAALVSAATLLGLKSHLPNLLRDAVFLLLGLSIGSTVTPEVIATALSWPLSLVILAVAQVVILFAGKAALVRGFGYDRMTGFLAATPGHLSYVVGLSVDQGADATRVMLVQVVRVLLLTLVVPVLIALWGIEAVPVTMVPDQMGWLAIALLLILSLGLGLVFKRLTVPAPLLLGAMAVSAIGHGADMTPGILPPWLTIAAFATMGTMIGTRFRGLGGAGLGQAMLAGLMITVIACSVAALGGYLAARLIGQDPVMVFLAFTPGGVEVMSAIAVEKGLEPAFVAAHHVARLIILSFLMPGLVVWTRRRSLAG